MSFTPQPPIYCDKCNCILAYFKRECGDTVLLHRESPCESSQEIYAVPSLELKLIGSAK